jgi:membrane protein DedA with SNARE-associated domain
MQVNSRLAFLIRNFIKGLLWLLVIITVFVLFNKFFNTETIEKWLAPVYENTILMIIIFLISEIVFGIIPPELFMIWALRDEMLKNYVYIIMLLSALSYLSGIAGYYFGRYLYTTKAYRFVRVRFLRRTERKLHIYGLYLIIVAALTPIPFSGVSMLIGSVKYPAKKYFLYSLFRFLRFAIYAVIIYAAIIWGVGIFGF